MILESNSAFLGAKNFVSELISKMRSENPKINCEVSKDLVFGSERHSWTFIGNRYDKFLSKLIDSGIQKYWMDSYNKTAKYIEIVKTSPIKDIKSLQRWKILVIIFSMGVALSLLAFLSEVGFEYFPKNLKYRVIRYHRRQVRKSRSRINIRRRRRRERFAKKSHKMRRTFKYGETRVRISIWDRAFVDVLHPPPDSLSDC